MKNFFKTHKGTILTIISCLILSTIFCLLFSFSTSPLYPNYYGCYLNDNLNFNGDSTQFMTIGKFWNDGLLPYRDTFDHKGPLIFFIDAIGFALGGKSGIIILQILALTISLFFITKICSLVSKKRSYQFIVCILTLIVLASCYVCGNSVQEYCLPFIIPAVYFFLNFLLKKPKKHPLKLALFYGLGIGFCIYTQPTNAIPTAAAIITTIIILIKNKQFKNLIFNLLIGLLGILIIILPFVIYFLVNNAFEEFIYSSTIYNFEYAYHVGSWLKNFKNNSFALFFSNFFSFLCLFPTIFLVIRRKKTHYLIFLIILGVLETYMFFFTQNFGQYAIITIFQLALFLNELLILPSNQKELSFIRTISLVICIIFCYNQFLSSLNFIPTFYNATKNPKKVSYEDLINKHLEDIRNSSFLSYGNHESKDVYLKYNLKPHEKYHVIQDWHKLFSKKVNDEIFNQFNTTDTRYILRDKTYFNFLDIIKKRYDLIEENDKYQLYRIKSSN